MPSYQQVQRFLMPGDTSYELPEVPFGTISRLELDDIESAMATQAKWTASEMEGGGTLVDFPGMFTDHKTFRMRVWWHG